MSDRRYGLDDDRESLRRAREPREPREPTVGELIDQSVRRVVTALVIAGGLIGFGVYAGGGGDVEAPDYQIASGTDGRVYRLNTDSGSIVVCENNQCWLMQSGSRDLDDEPPRPTPQQAVPAPAQPQAQLPAPSPAPAQAPAQTPAPAAEPAQK
jgi:hypothetical protein